MGSRSQGAKGELRQDGPPAVCTQRRPGGVGSPKLSQQQGLGATPVVLVNRRRIQAGEASAHSFQCSGSRTPYEDVVQEVGLTCILVFVSRAVSLDPG